VLHAKSRAPSAPASANLLDVQVSALIYLLARCARRPCDGASAQLALDHLGMLARNVEASALLRQTAARLEDQWRRRADATDAKVAHRPETAEPGDAAGAASPAPREPQGARFH
jgi:hypothetical protein